MMREAESEYRENNMNLSEIWQYYYDDDIDDPYAPIDDIENTIITSIKCKRKEYYVFTIS